MDGLVKGLVMIFIQMVFFNKGYFIGYLIIVLVVQGICGYLYQIVNGGKIWICVYGIVIDNLMGVYMVDNVKGFVIVLNGLLLYMVNGGMFWDVVNIYGLGIMEDFIVLFGDGGFNVVVLICSGKLLCMNSGVFIIIVQIL